MEGKNFYGAIYLIIKIYTFLISAQKMGNKWSEKQITHNFYLYVMLKCFKFLFRILIKLATVKVLMFLIGAKNITTDCVTLSLRRTPQLINKV